MTQILRSLPLGIFKAFVILIAISCMPLCVSAESTVIILIGPTGAGKGTNGKLLSEWTALPHISIGDLFRSAMRQDPYFADLVTRSLSYELEEIAAKLTMDRLNRDDCSKGYILDGYPRTLNELQIVTERFSASQDRVVTLVLDIAEDNVRKRLSSRYICPACTRSYGKHDMQEETLCSHCFTALVKRDDDVDSKRVSAKLRAYFETVDPIIEGLTEKFPLIRINVDSKSPDTVFTEITNKLTELGIK